MAFLVPRRERGLVVGEAEQILREIQTRIRKPFRSPLRVRRAHVVETNSDPFRSTAGAAVTDDTAEAPRQRPESLRIVDRPLV